MSTYDCPPTLTDSQVVEFCKTGYILLEGVVPDEINQRVVAWLEDHRAAGRDRQVVELLAENWFIEHVVRNAQAAGVMRSLLGADYAEPNWLAWFRGEGRSAPGQWHVDGGSRFSPALDILKWFYYPADTPAELGPTEFVTGSHHVYHQVRFMAHYDAIRGVWKCAAPAGSIMLGAYALWHRRARCTADGVRHMVTSSVHRTSPPRRDWIAEADFDITDVNFHLDEPRFGEQFRQCHDASRLFCWLCGQIDDFETEPGPAWPEPRHKADHPRHGLPEGLNNLRPTVK